jgi:uncharacterized membrane protein
MDLEIEVDGKIIALILVVGAIAGGLGISYLNGKGGIIEILVVDEHGKGVEGSILSIISNHHKIKGVTNPEGKAAFGDLKEGDFYINAEDPGGYLVQEGDYQVTLESGETIKVEITMVPLVNLEAPGKISEFVQLNEIKTTTIPIENPGHSTVTFTPILEDAPPWITLLNGSTTIEAGGNGSLYIQVNPPSDAEAGSTETFTVASLDGGFETTIEVTLQETGRLTLPRNIRLMMEKGSSTSGTFRIQNNGDGPVKDLVLASEGEAGDWMELTPSTIPHISDRRSPQYWEDIEYKVYIPSATEPGTYYGKVLCSYGATTQSVTVETEVLPHDVSLKISPTTLRMKDNEDIPNST